MRVDETFIAVYGPVVVPRGHAFLLGDRRQASADSRKIGFLARENMVARAMTIFLSEDPETGKIHWDRAGRVIR